MYKFQISLELADGSSIRHRFQENIPGSKLFKLIDQEWQRNEMVMEPRSSHDNCSQQAESNKETRNAYCYAA